ncbi:MAG TPA: alpha/beta fold hydrolase [Thermoanaerobaculia bacterium]|nr:alpha/beta fold hydrolase [Thermoanaerobaculia bacterium]
MTGERKSVVYAFGRFRMEVAERRLLSDTGEVSLTPKAFDTLVALVENSGRLVPRDELLSTVWPETYVGENVLAQNISTLRKALGPEGTKLLETVPKRGYRFLGDVSTLDEPEPIVRDRIRTKVAVEEEGEPERRPPETKYARNGDVNIAYQVIGDAPLDLVFVMGWISHLDYFWREPSFARFLLRLSTFARLILFDKRGTGLSDRVANNELPTLEQRMDDVRAVMDAVGSKRAALLGVSEGGPMCSLFAATYPERTSALVMIGTYAKRIYDDDYPWAPTLEQRQKFFDVIRADWGKPVGIEARAPSMANDPVFREWWATYLRMGASPGAALALTQMNAEIDVRPVLPTIRVPTLVLHRSDDLCLKVEEGRYVASRIPGSKYVELPGADHLPFVGDQEAILGEIEEFLTGVRHGPQTTDSMLATVLVLQMDVPQIREGVDDSARRLITHAAREIERFRGREIHSVGNRTVAIFDGPARAIRCASTLTEYARRLALPLRAGLHTGDVELRPGARDRRFAGAAVDICLALAASAAPEEVLVSSTVKDLVAGSGILFEERSSRAFPGLGEWRLYAVARQA